MKLRAFLVVGLAGVLSASACGGESDNSDDDDTGGKAGAGAGGSGKGGATAGGSAGTSAGSGGKAGSAGKGGTANGGTAGRGTSGGTSGESGSGAEGGAEGGAPDPGGAGGEAGTAGANEGGENAGGAAGATGGAGSSGTAGAGGTAGSSGAAGSGGSGGSPNPVSISTAVAGDLVITEIMRDPRAVDDTLGEWFEVYNTTATAFDLDGLVLADGTGEVTIDEALILPAGSHAVFARNAGAGNGGVTPAFTYGDVLQLGNTSDVVRLSAASLVIDEVSFSSNTGFPDFAGASLTLVGTPDAGQNDVAGAWCAAGTRFGAGDLGTPGAANGACLRYGADLQSGDVVITEIMPNPRAVLDNLGEWFEVYNPGPGAVDLEGVTVSDLAEDTFTVGASLLIDAGDQAVFGLNGTVGTNGGIPVDYVYPAADFTLANGTNGDEVVIAYAGTLIDQVAYLQTFSFGNGISMSLSPGGTAITNDAAANWCAAGTTLGSDDRGTPGLANDACP